jgi:hypothetical protein
MMELTAAWSKFHIFHTSSFILLVLCYNVQQTLNYIYTSILPTLVVSCPLYFYSSMKVNTSLEPRGQHSELMASWWPSSLSTHSNMTFFFSQTCQISDYRADCDVARDNIGFGRVRPKCSTVPLAGPEYRQSTCTYGRTTSERTFTMEASSQI